MCLEGDIPVKTKKRRTSIFAVLVVIVLLIIIAATIATNVIFSDNKLPKLAGYYLYMHETEDLEPDIPQNSLVFAKEAPSTSLAPGSKVLCNLSDGTMAARVIYQITVNADGTSSYYPGTALEQGLELAIPRENIFAICTWQSKDLYAYVNFATQVKGLMLLLVVPSIILIIMLLAKIARGSSEVVDDDDFMFDEIEEMTRKPASADNPLFEPSQTPATGESLEKKKSSISENFEKKPVNENSPYQKAVQERTMKFRIQQQNIEEAKRQEEAMKSRGGTQIFSAQTVEDAAKQYAAEVSAPAEIPEAAEAPVQEIETAAPVEAAVSEPRTAPTAAPNIDDIVKPSELRAAKTGRKINPEIAATDSIDDLLRVLEAEKKKL